MAVSSVVVCLVAYVLGLFQVPDKPVNNFDMVAVQVEA